MVAGASNSSESAAAAVKIDTAPLRPNWLRTGLSAAADLLYPPRCACCGDDCVARPGQPVLCTSCEVELSPADQPACPRCAMPCSAADAGKSDCYECRGRKLLFDEARTIGVYDGALRTAVLKIKHYQHEPLARALGSHLAGRIAAGPFAAAGDWVVPVPMHWLQRMWRGTNAADTLARSVAAALRWKLASGLLVCRRMLRRQNTLPPEQRRENVRNAFRVSWRYNIRGARILLVDDVMTTGATAHEAARVLRKAGAAAVYVAAVARGTGGF